MTNTTTVCLLNDSFPPLIDGVANTVVNYASHLPSQGYEALVLTPDHPDANDCAFSYPVIRYPSIKTRLAEGYPAGIPFSPEVVRRVSSHPIRLLHTHCPVVSTILARELRQIQNVPVVLTYHTKFDLDIAHIVKSKSVQDACKRVLLGNIQACDEVWTVSQGAGENLRELGYEGEYIVMPNGVDLPRSRASAATILAATQAYDLPQGVPVYLFVGRMMWYKGIRVILDALALLQRRGAPFRMVFIGDGEERQPIMDYAASLGLGSTCLFLGALHDREILRGWYSRADLFLFPSTFDTNGLVVREAAACSLASVLIRGSCAAEGITHGRNGFLIEQTGESLAACLSVLTPETMRTVGETASCELYLSWSDAVAQAAQRYAFVIDRYQRGAYPSHRKPAEAVLKANAEVMEALAILPTLRRRSD